MDVSIESLSLIDNVNGPSVPNTPRSGGPADGWWYLERLRKDSTDTPSGQRTKACVSVYSPRNRTERWSCSSHGGVGELELVELELAISISLSVSVRGSTYVC